MRITEREPVALAGAVPGVLSALVAVLVAFDVWQPTESQVAAISGLMAALIAVVTTLARGKAWSPASVAVAVEEARTGVLELADARQAAAVAEAKIEALPPPVPPPVPLAVPPPIVAAVYNPRLNQWDTIYLRPARVGMGTFGLTPAAHNGLPVAERRPDGPLAPIGPEAQSAMGLRETVPHPGPDGN